MRRPGLIALGIAGLAAALNLRYGTTTDYGWGEWASGLIAGPGGDSTTTAILWRVRGPRVGEALLGGALLGLSGAAFQGVLRNPLAEPYVLGVSSGAAAGGAAVTMAGMGMAAGGLGVLGGGLVGGLLSLGLVLALARRDERGDPTRLLLAGVATGALLGAVVSLVVVLSGGDANRLLAWLLGSTAEAFWLPDAVMAAVLALGLVALGRDAGRLDALAVAGVDAGALGVDVGRVSRRVLLVGTFLAATAVGAMGIVGFVGLLAPHLARRLAGTEWCRSLPLSAGLGAAVLALADFLAGRSEKLLSVGVPVGVVTALLGAPWLLVLLRRRE